MSDFHWGSRNFVELLRGECRPVAYRKRQQIFPEGSRSDAAFFVEHGAVKLTVTSPQGREAVIATLRAGDFFGHEALDPSSPPRCNRAVALTNVQLVRIGQSPLLHLLNTKPSLYFPIISLLVRMVSQYQRELAGNLIYSSDQRLARALLLISEITESDARFSPSKLSQQELAEMVGTTRQRVNAIMQRFKKMGLIDYSHGLHIHDSLRNFAGLDKTFR